MSHSHATKPSARYHNSRQISISHCLVSCACRLLLGGLILYLSARLFCRKFCRTWCRAWCRARSLNLLFPRFFVFGHDIANTLLNGRAYRTFSFPGPKSDPEKRQKRGKSKLQGGFIFRKFKFRYGAFSEICPAEL